MDAGAKSYRAGMVSVPAVLIAAAWVGVWLLWPSPRSAARRMPRGAGTDVAYVRLGAKSAILFRDGAGVPDRDVEGLGVVPAGPSRPVRSLAMGSGWGSGAMSNGVESVPERARKQMGIYRVVPEGTTVFSAVTNRAPRLTTAVSQALQARDLRLPAFPPETLAGPGRSWEMTVTLDVAEDGTVRNVFLESGCGDDKTNGTVVRLLERATAGRKGQRCSGRLTLRYGPP
jgi:hypothetical protein